jgi:hypothetical protein
MDWFSVWEPVGYVETEPVQFTTDLPMLVAWLVVAVVVLAALIAWYRQRIVRRSFWCATAGRDVEIFSRRGRVLSCSSFDDPAAVACARRCQGRAFRVQWPRPLPVLGPPPPVR